MSGAGWIDLAAANTRHQAVQADVCVIGAGAAGIYLAVRLAEKGHSVVLLEAGGNSGSGASEAGFDVEFSGKPYPGATLGRFFGMGGSTSRWGGQIVPHMRHDIRDTADDFDAWSHVVKTVGKHTDDVLFALGYRHGGDYEQFATRQLGQVDRALRAAGIDVAAGLMLPFRYKNLVHLLGRTNARKPIRVFYNSVANAWAAAACGSEEARVQSLLAVSPNHKHLEVVAKRYVITAGAIESARILLELDESGSQAVVRPTAATGCYLADHLSLPIADVTFDSLDRAKEIFAPRFVGGWMRGFRFMEASPPTRAPRGFAHFIFENTNPGFDLAKEILGAMQSRRLPVISLASVVNGLGGLFGLAYNRYIHSVLYLPPETPAHLQLDIEQAAVRDNRVSLGAELDRFGRRSVRINWRIGERDIENIQQMAKRLLINWPGAKAGLPTLVPKPSGSSGAKPYDAYHPVGTCRMGEDSEAVVDRNLKVWGVQNLWVVSTGVLPSAGTANPTFSMLCLAQQLAEDIGVAA